jgi:CysZ protein
MEVVFRAALNAVGDLRVPGMMKLFVSCIALTVVAALMVVALGVWLIDLFLIPHLPNDSDVSSGVIAWVIHFLVWTGAVSAVIIPLFLFFWSLMIFIASFFDEYIAEKIENFRYPKLALGHSAPFWSEFRHDIYFSAKLFLLNIAVLIPLVLIPIFWVLLPIIFPLMNGYALGRYFFCMAGGRHIGRKAAYLLAAEHRWKITLSGLLFVFASTIPFLNLLVPFWGVAMMVHLYHLIDKPPVVEVLPN